MTKPIISQYTQANASLPCPLLELPSELLQLIFSKLPSLNDICSLGLTCRQLQALSDDRLLWKSLCTSICPHSRISQTPQLPSRLYKDQIYFEHTLCHKTGIPRDLPIEGKPRSVIIYDNLLYSISDLDEMQSTFAIWDLTTGECVDSHQDFAGELNCFRCENRIYLVDDDGSVQVWDSISVKCTHEFFLEAIGENLIERMVLSQNMLYALLQDGTLGCWNVETGKCLQSWKQFSPWICGMPLAYDQGYLWMPMTNSENEELPPTSIEVVEVASGKQVVLRDIGCFRQLKIAGNFGILQSLSQIKAVDLSTGKCVKCLLPEEINARTNHICEISIKGTRLILQPENDHFELYDITDPTKPQHLKFWDDVKEKITYNWIVDNQYYAVLDDNSIKVWDILSGECQTLVSSEVENSSFRSICQSDNRIAVYSTNGIMRIFCQDTKQCLSQWQLECQEDTSMDIPFIQEDLLFLVAKDLEESPESKTTIKIYDIRAQRLLQTIDSPSSELLSVIKEKHRVIMTPSSGPIRVWDFGRPTTPFAHFQLLEENAEILRRMQVSELTPQIQLAKELHLPIKHRLDVENNGSIIDSPYSQEAISHLLIEIDTAILRYAVEVKNQDKLREILSELTVLTPSRLGLLYELLWLECGKPDVRALSSGCILSQQEIEQAVSELHAKKGCNAMEIEKSDPTAMETDQTHPLLSHGELHTGLEELNDDLSLRKEIHHWAEIAFCHHTPSVSTNQKIDALLKWGGSL